MKSRLFSGDKQYHKVDKEIYLSPRKVMLNKLFKAINKRKKCNKFLILQWGSKRSIIQNVSDINNPILIVDNQYLMNLDEMGLIL